MTSVELLIRDSILVIEEGVDLLQMLSDQQYQQPFAFSSSGIGPHMRHVFDHYTCFLDGLAAVFVSYESRDRDERFETDVRFAISQFNTLISRLEGLSDQDPNMVFSLEIVHDDESYPISSTLGRELQFLLSHTLHHFAMVRMMAVTLGLPVSNQFGMAPSTKRFLATSTS
jgi:uncharacterized damage-inducible protein DinB